MKKLFIRIKRVAKGVTKIMQPGEKDKSDTGRGGARSEGARLLTRTKHKERA